jgi:hypothetical protein
MKAICVAACVLLCAGFCFAQEEEVTYETATTTTTGADDLMRELWFVDDATPIATGAVDMRLTFRWETASAPANLGDSDDDFIFTPSLTWGSCENVEVFVDVPIWLGDGGDRGAIEEGNYDTFLGFTWRIAEPEDIWPAAALRTTVRVPTGRNSAGLDGELRLILTNEYDSGIRSHINVFGAAICDAPEGPEPDPPVLVTGFFDDEGPADPRHFQWGVVLGLDGPLCGDGAVRWVADYLHRSSFYYGSANMNMLELGWEWTMEEAQKLGMSVQIGLDDEDDTPNFGAALGYAFALTQ